MYQKMKPNFKVISWKKEISYDAKNEVQTLYTPSLYAEFLRDMLRVRPGQRFNLKMCLEHSFMKESEGNTNSTYDVGTSDDKPDANVQSGGVDNNNDNNVNNNNNQLKQDAAVKSTTEKPNGKYLSLNAPLFRLVNHEYGNFVVKNIIFHLFKASDVSLHSVNGIDGNNNHSTNGLNLNNRNGDNAVINFFLSMVC